MKTAYVQPPRVRYINERAKGEAQAYDGGDAAPLLNPPPLETPHRKMTVVPGLAQRASFCASQFVRRTQPCDCV